MPKFKHRLLKRPLNLCMLILALMLGNVVHANDDSIITERSRLENAINELTLLQQFINNTQHSVKRDSKARFNYPAFNADVDILKHGIERYLNEYNSRPKSQRPQIKPIRGEYST